MSADREDALQSPIFNGNNVRTTEGAWHVLASHTAG